MIRVESLHFQSPEPEQPIPSDLMLDKIFSNLSEISSVFHKVKEDQRAKSFNIAAIKVNTLRDLKFLTTYVTSLFSKLESLNKDTVSSSKLIICQDVLSEKTNFVHSSLSSKIYYMHDHLYNVSS